MDKNITLDFSLFDGFPDMCFLVNENGVIRLFNRVAEKQLGFTANKPDIFFDYVELCDRAKAERLYQESSDNKTSTEFETRLFVQKHFINVKLTFVPFSKNGVDEKLVFVTARDISEEKKKEIDLLKIL